LERRIKSASAQLEEMGITDADLRALVEPHILSLLQKSGFKISAPPHSSAGDEFLVSVVTIRSRG
jgi:hypothetical protein